MRKSSYPYKRQLMAASVLSLVGQSTAIAFMVRPGPYTTFVFMTVGSGMILSGMAVFGYVMFRDIRNRIRSISERRFRKGDFVFRQGEPGDRVYVVKSGEVEVVRGDPGGVETVVARLGEGEYFGEMALLSDAPRNASVRAATDVVALAIERHDFHSLFSSIPAFQRSVDTAIRRRTR